MNRVQLEGNVGAAPDLSYTPGGKAVCRLRLATGGQQYPDKQTGELKRARTDWHTVEFWDLWAERAAKVVQKGAFVHVEGEVRNVEWEDKETGQKRYATVIRGRLFVVFPRKPKAGRGAPPIEDDGAAGGSVPPAGAGGALEAPHDDDIPF